MSGTAQNVGLLQCSQTMACTYLTRAAMTAWLQLSVCSKLLRQGSCGEQARQH